MPDDREALAKDRTDLAEDRTVLANERTFAGWLRTGLSSVAIALGFHALFGRVEPGWAPRAMSTFLLVTAIYIFWAAERRAAAVQQRLDRHHVKSVGRNTMRVLAVAMSAAAAGLIAIVWLLPFSGD